MPENLELHAKAFAQLKNKTSSSINPASSEYIIKLLSLQVNISSDSLEREMPLTQHLNPSLSYFIFNKAEKIEESKILFPPWRPLTISWMTPFLRSKDSSVMAELWASENLYAFRLNCFSKWRPDGMKNPTAGMASQLCCLLNSASQWLLPLLVLRPLLSHKEDAQDEEQRCQRKWLGAMSHHEGMEGCRGRWYLLCCWRIAWTFVPPFRELESPEWGQGECWRL